MKYRYFFLLFTALFSLSSCQNSQQEGSLAKKIVKAPVKKIVQPIKPAIAKEDILSAQKTGTQIIVAREPFIIESNEVAVKATDSVSKKRLLFAVPEPKKNEVNYPQAEALFRVIDGQINSNALLAPKNNNALISLAAVKKMAPDHPLISVYRDKISDRLTEMGNVSFQTGKVLAAKAYLGKALVLNPSNARAKKIVDGLNPQVSSGVP